MTALLPTHGAAARIARIALNGTDIQFASRDDAWLCEQALDAAVFKEANALTFQTRAGVRDRVLAASRVTFEG